MGQVKPKVVLVRATPEPDRLVEAAARLCYAEETGDLLERKATRDGRFVKMLKSLGHLSPIEHVSFTFYIEGVSRAMTHQLVRHRLASFSQRSQRYVSHQDFHYTIPPRFRDRTVTLPDGSPMDAVAFFKETMDILAGRYRLLKESLGGRGEESNEDARYVLPNACETRIFVTMNARELLHFFGLRLCMRAQWEIRDVAEKMLALVRKEAPSIFSGVGPKCIAAGRCPEGKRTCGRLAEMKTRYGERASEGTAALKPPEEQDE